MGLEVELVDDVVLRVAGVVLLDVLTPLVHHVAQVTGLVGVLVEGDACPLPILLGIEALGRDADAVLGQRGRRQQGECGQRREREARAP